MQLAGAFKSKIEFSSYTIESKKIPSPIRIIAVCDLHDRLSEEEIPLMCEKIAFYKPDAIMMCGDIFDEGRDHSNSLALISELSKSSPVFYVTGNHEYNTKEADKLKRKASLAGACVLDGDRASLDCGGGLIYVYGVDDKNSGSFFSQLKTCGSALDASSYSILLSHRPEYTGFYTAYGFDLAICGHAHGGQWRLPRVLNGLYSPGQGLFPKYTSGLYYDAGKIMAVSRGLSDVPKHVPRIFNPPEIMVIDLQPEKKQID
ncbi:MAG: metallophosphoesterase [Eubacteriaceae bacterium]|nr:metallophosphoesterase [Eubacteriaceae bacterium]